MVILIKRPEYVITRPDTPTPWINYIGSGKYEGFVSNTGGGHSFHTDPRNRRITRYRYNNIPMDSNEVHTYIRDRVTGEYWNPVSSRYRENLIHTGAGMEWAILF